MPLVRRSAPLGLHFSLVPSTLETLAYRNLAAVALSMLDPASPLIASEQKLEKGQERLLTENLLKELPKDQQAMGAVGTDFSPLAASQRASLLV